MDEFILPLNTANIDLTELTDDLLAKAQVNVNDLGTAANDYLHVFGYTAMAYIWARMAKTSLANLSGEATDNNANQSKAFYQSKVHTARYFFTKLLPRRLSLIENAKSGSDCLFDIEDDLF
jgi:hypothetical protein